MNNVYWSFKNDNTNIWNILDTQYSYISFLTNSTTSINTSLLFSDEKHKDIFSFHSLSLSLYTPSPLISAVSPVGHLSCVTILLLLLFGLICFWALESKCFNSTWTNRLIYRAKCVEDKLVWKRQKYYQYQSISCFNISLKKLFYSN